MIPRKQSCRGASSLTNKIRESLIKVGDSMKVENENERKTSYNRALQIGVKICTRKLENGDIYIYRVN